ncbi:hypothetical protein B0I37DRAFT_350760 [Chaetomium sp. MPI-CAGE-AT-0009]|nr:hypothetical protein B0I37DRAFT_350760 [Chaetomium sp. MPI-CAGE-AT-0009]
MVSPGSNNPIRMMYQQQSINPTQIKDFQEAYARLDGPNAHVQVSQEEDGLTTFYFNAEAETGGYVYQTHSASAAASILHIAQQKGAKIEQLHVDVLAVKGGAQIQSAMGVPVYAGADAGAYLVDADVGAFHGALGLAADTEIGCKDQSIGCKVLGCGLKVGRVCEVSVFGSSIGIDWGKFGFP